MRSEDAVMRSDRREMFPDVALENEDPGPVNKVMQSRGMVKPYPLDDRIARFDRRNIRSYEEAFIKMQSELILLIRDWEKDGKQPGWSMDFNVGVGTCFRNDEMLVALRVLETLRQLVGT